MARGRQRRRQGNVPAGPDGGATTGPEAESWVMADAPRGWMEAAEYKQVVLGLIFLKYISDAFEECHVAVLAKWGNEAAEDRDESTAENIFWVSPDAGWGRLKAQARQPTVGPAVDDAMAAVERDNPALKGVLSKDYVRPALDKQWLGQLIDMIGNIQVGDAEVRSKDMLGRVYEYLLSRFASAEGKKGGEFHTPRCVVRLLVELLDPYRGRVYDPCCGSSGCTVEEARFVPVEANGLPESMDAWECSIHAEIPDKPVQLTTLHAEFEALNPFLDGNGRLGRMPVPLFLWQAGLVRTFMFYISAYFEARCGAYYGGLLAVSRDDDWTGWYRFFLEAVRLQAEGNMARAQGIREPSSTMKGRVEYPRGRSGPVPVLPLRSGLDLRTPDLSEPWLRVPAGDPGPHGAADTQHPEQGRHPQGHRGGTGPSGRRPGVSRTVEHRRGRGGVLRFACVTQRQLSLMILAKNERQIGLSPVHEPPRAYAPGKG